MPGMLAGLLRAAPPYLGGKRQLVPLAFGLLARHLPRAAWSQLHLLDPMCGGGALALTAKALGFVVTASDLAERGAVVARALIANSDRRLTSADIALAFRHPVTPTPPVVRGITGAQGLWCGTLLAEASRQQEPLHSLLRLVMITGYLRGYPLSMPSATDAAAAAAGDWDRISPRRLGHYVRRQASATPDEAWRIARRINAGVFAGRGHASHGDARDVISRSVADVVVLDPPYPGTTGYADTYAALDALLGDCVPEGTAPSLDELLDAAAGVPWAVITYGGRGVALDSLVECVRRHRRVVSAVAVPYAHLRSVAREDTRERNREHIIIARG